MEIKIFLSATILITVTDQQVIVNICNFLLLPFSCSLDPSISAVYLVGNLNLFPKTFESLVDLSLWG